MAKKSVNSPVLTYEDHLATAWQLFKSHHASDHVPASNLQIKVGDAIFYGARVDCRVEEVFEDGRILHISHHDVGTVSGTPYDNGRKPQIIWWTDACPVVL